MDSGSLSDWEPAFQQVAATNLQTKATSLAAGVLALLTVTPFFYTGFDTIPQQAEEAAQGLDWHRFGRIISLSLLAAGGFYMICIAAFSSLMPWTAFVQEPLAALACLRQLNFTLYFVMLCITVLGALGPMNSFYASSARLVTAMARKQQLPLIFTPPPGKPAAASTHALLIFCTVLAPFLGGNMLLPLTNVAALTFMFACTMVCLACYRLRCFIKPCRIPAIIRLDCARRLSESPAPLWAQGINNKSLSVIELTGFYYLTGNSDSITETLKTFSL